MVSFTIQFTKVTPNIYLSGLFILSMMFGGQRDSSVAKNTCSYRPHGFTSQHSHSGSKVPATRVPGDPVPSSDLCRHQAPTYYRYIHTGKTLTHVN